MHTPFPEPLSFTKYLPFALGLLLVFSACDDNGPVDDEETAFEQFDADASGEIDENEFGASFSQTDNFGTFDADASGDIDEDEFNAGAFGVFDTNDDEEIDEEEFDAGSDFFGVNQTFADFDVDESGALTRGEFDTAFAGTDLFADFGAGDAIDEGEFNAGVFGAFDADASAGIDEDEFDAGDAFFDVGVQ